MNYNVVDVDLPKCSTNSDSYVKYSISFINILNIDRVTNFDPLLYFGALEGEFSRKVTYNPKDGRIFYITDLKYQSSKFLTDLFNRLIIYYEWTIEMLDISFYRCSAEDSEKLAQDIYEQNSNRYLKWEEEVEHFDYILKAIEMNISDKAKY